MVFKKIIFFSLILLNSGLLFSQTIDSINYTDDNGLKQGIWTEQSGNNLKKGLYIDNKKEGQWLTFNKNDYVLEVENYQSDVYNGYVVKMDNRGYVKSATYYRMGVKDGTEFIYTYSARLLEKYNYKNGKLHGDVLLNYDNGKTQETSFYKEGNRHGTTRWYDYEGNLVAEYQYNQGQLEGLQKSFYPSEIIMKEEHYKNNVLNGLSTEYYETGQIKWTGEYKASKKNGKWIHYDLKGNEIEVQNFKNGEQKK